MSILLAEQALGLSNDGFGAVFLVCSRRVVSLALFKLFQLVAVPDKMARLTTEVALPGLRLGVLLGDFCSTFGSRFLPTCFGI